MTLTFIETRGFSQAVQVYFADDAAYAAFQADLLKNPEAGSMMTNKNPQAQRPPFFERLEVGLNEALAHVQGGMALKTHTMALPDPPPPYSAERVRRLRAHLGMSQPYFSRLLNVSPKTVQSWEQGVRVPSQSAARLLQIIEDPEALAALRQTVPK